jgi:hypothetical protein
MIKLALMDAFASTNVKNYIINDAPLMQVLSLVDFISLVVATMHS